MRDLTRSRKFNLMAFLIKWSTAPHLRLFIKSCERGMTFQDIWGHLLITWNRTIKGEDKTTHSDYADVGKPFFEWSSSNCSEEKQQKMRPKVEQGHEGRKYPSQSRQKITNRKGKWDANNLKEFVVKKYFAGWIIKCE